MDTHNQSGSHWVSVFINVSKSTIFYFDSVGHKIPPNIEKFVNTVIKQGDNLNINFIFDQNYPTEHQYKDTECGIYSLFFIIYMLEDKINGDYLKNHILKDEYIEQYRNIFFNNYTDFKS